MDAQAACAGSLACKGRKGTRVSAVPWTDNCQLRARLHQTGDFLEKVKLTNEGLKVKITGYCAVREESERKREHLARALSICLFTERARGQLARDKGKR